MDAVSNSKPNYIKWARRPLWTLADAATLCIDIEPFGVPPTMATYLPRIAEPAKREIWEDLYTTSKLATRAGELEFENPNKLVLPDGTEHEFIGGRLVKPHRYIEWVRDKRFEFAIPLGLVAALQIDAISEREESAVYKDITDGLPATTETAREKEGIERKDILATDWPLNGNFTQDSLARALSDVPGWLNSARVIPGRRGMRGSATWNPVMIAVALVDKNYANRRALDRFFETQFPEWADDWTEYKAICDAGAGE